MLYLHTHEPIGHTAAERHLAALTERLTAYVNEHLLPAAEREWETAAKRGQGYRFSPYRVDISLTSPPNDPCHAVLSFSVRAGEQEPQAKTLHTHWSKDLSYQLKPKHRRKGSKIPLANR